MTAFLVLVAVLSILVLAFILFAPWKAVRDEPKLDKTVEAQLLLHRNHDEPIGESAGESAAVTAVGNLDDETDPAATYDDLAALDEPPGAEADPSADR